MPLQRYVDNMFGNADDQVRGRQMPDHVTGKRYRYGSVSSPIGTQIMHAVGVAWAAKLKRDELVAAAVAGRLPNSKGYVRANCPLWISRRMRFISLRVSSFTTRGPRV